MNSFPEPKKFWKNDFQLSFKNLNIKKSMYFAQNNICAQIKRFHLQ